MKQPHSRWLLLEYSMKATAASKTWDDVFPDNHQVEFPVPKTSNKNNIDFEDQATPARHWRSRSAPDEEAPSASWDVSPQPFSQWREDLKCMREGIDGEKGIRQKKKHGKKDRRISLEQDVKHLQTKLKSERAAKDILEQALGRASSVLIPVNSSSVSQRTRNLIKDIALLELEVAHLEQHLLSLYRKVFEHQINGGSCESKVQDMCKVSKSQDCGSHQVTVLKVAHNPTDRHGQSGSLVSKTLNTSVGNHSFNEAKVRQSASVCNTPRKDGGLRSSYSQPMPLAKKETEGSPLRVACELWREVISAESTKNASFQNIFSENSLLGEQMCETPNKLSEELVRCMAAIYCKLADPPIPHLGGSISPSSSSSSASTFSPKEHSSDGWSPRWRTDGSCNISSSDSCQGKNITEGMGGYNLMVEVPWICVDNDRLTYAAKMLRNFRSLVQQLERINPGQLKQGEKLAFWLNIYNALMMHAYLAYGIPRNHLKRVSLLQKAAYKIGMHSINAHTIEQSLLGCRSHRPAQWIQMLLSPGSKIRGDDRQAYALESPEPLVCFALCCGGRSDPAVRVYTAKNVCQELDVAKREFLQASIGVHKENKILLPRILESFARESSMGTLGLLEWICQNVPEKQRRVIRQCINSKPHKCIEWVPYNFSFRYLFVRDLARWFPPNSA